MFRKKGEVGFAVSNFPEAIQNQSHMQEEKKYDYA
jgi:hypothetical protein